MHPAPTVRALARTLLLAPVLAGAALLAGCGRPAANAPQGMPPPAVSVVTVQPAPVPVAFEYVGQTAGYREVEVRARVSGILMKRNYLEGTQVKAGQSLFTIDPAPFQAALARAEADLAGSEARLARAERDARRLQPLYEAKAVSQKEFDDAVSARQVAAAEVKAAQARLREARLNMEYTRVESPITGIASRALKSEGSLVSGPDVLLTTVTQVDPMYVIFGMPETEQLRLREDAAAGRLQLPRDGRFDVTVTLSDGTRYAKPGKLDFADVRVSGATGTSEARAALPNGDASLRPGQFVRVRLSGAERPNAITVPQRAVLEGPQGKFVYVVNGENKAEPRPVQVGDWSGDAWIVTSGLQGGERVIVDGMMKVMPGAVVSIVPEGAPSGQPPAPKAGEGEASPRTVRS